MMNNGVSLAYVLTEYPPCQKGERANGKKNPKASETHQNAEDRTKRKWTQKLNPTLCHLDIRNSQKKYVKFVFQA